MSYRTLKVRARLSGGNVRNAKIKNERVLFNSALNDDPSFCDSIFLVRAGEDDRNIPIALFGKDYSAAGGFTAHFNAPADNAPLTGDILCDRKNGTNMLVTESFDISEIYRAGKVTYCTIVLKWQDDTGRVLEYPAADYNAADYGAGVSLTQLIGTGSTKHIIMLTADSNTLCLSRGKRLFLYRAGARPCVYKISAIDTTSLFTGRGIVRLTLSEDVFDDEKDDTERGICDLAL